MQSVRNLFKIVYIKTVTQCFKISSVTVIISPCQFMAGKHIFVSIYSQILREKMNTFVANLKGLISTFVFLFFKDTPPPTHTRHLQDDAAEQSSRRWNTQREQV